MVTEPCVEFVGNLDGTVPSSFHLQSKMQASRILRIDRIFAARTTALLSSRSGQSSSITNWRKLTAVSSFDPATGAQGRSQHPVHLESLGLPPLTHECT